MSQTRCEKGFYCAFDTGRRFPCPSGTYGSEEGLSDDLSPLLGDNHVTSCSGLCAPGYYCPSGSTSSSEVKCPAGTYGSTPGLRDANCSASCPVGHYCPAGSVKPIKCPTGVYGAVKGLRDMFCSPLCSSNLCSDDDIRQAKCFLGYFCPEGSTSPTERECGGTDVFCPRGSASPTPVSRGYYSIGYTRTTTYDQQICNLGHYCMNGVQIPCPSGVFGGSLGLHDPACSGVCPAGYYCPTGSTNGTTHRCPAGRYGATSGLTDRACSGFCAAGYYCPEGSTSPFQKECGSYLDGSSMNSRTNRFYCPVGSPIPLTAPGGYYSIGQNTTTRVSIVICPAGTYCSDGVIRDCPPGRFGNTEGLATADCSGACKKGFYCPVGSTISIQEPCPRGRYGSVDGLGSPLCSGPCQNPHDCEPGSTMDRPLPTDGHYTES